MTIDRDLERMLGSALREQRPIGGAPPALRSRVDSIPEAFPSEWLVVRVLKRHTVTIAGAGLAAAAVVVSAVGFSRAPVIGLPSGGVAAQPTGFDPAIEGVGLLTGVVPSLAYVGWAVAALAAIVAFRELFSVRSGTTRGRVLIVLGVVIAGLASGMARLDGWGWLSRGSTAAVLLGYDLEAPPSVFDLGGDVYYETAAPGEPTASMFSVRNTSILPVRIEGIVVPEGYASLAGAHWTAVWLAPSDAWDEIVGLDRVRPFEPTTIAPGEELQIYLIGRAGPCAYGPSFDPTDEADPDYAGASQLGPFVTVAHSVLGLTSTVAINTETTFVEPTRNACP
jgi:hypothetical protein